MFSSTPYILAASLFFSFTQSGPIASNTNAALWTQLCSGQVIRLDLGENDPLPQQPPHNKACHAVCCPKENGIDDAEPQG